MDQMKDYVPKAEHDATVAKLGEMRDNNRALNRKVSELEEKALDPAKLAELEAAAAKLTAFEAKYADIDPDEYKSLKARPDLSARVIELETALATEKAAKSAAQQAADSATFRAKVSDAFLAGGGRSEALDFIIAKAEKTFTLANGQLTTKEFSATRPGESLSLDEWVVARSLDNAFAYQPSSGGGARGGAGGGGKQVVGRDPLEIGKNAAAIARGDVLVQP
jgi:hypothetical protein